MNQYLLRIPCPDAGSSRCLLKRSKVPPLAAGAKFSLPAENSESLDYCWFDISWYTQNCFQWFGLLMVWIYAENALKTSLVIMPYQLGSSIIFVCPAHWSLVSRFFFFFEQQKLAGNIPGLLLVTMGVWQITLILSYLDCKTWWWFQIFFIFAADANWFGPGPHLFQMPWLKPSTRKKSEF